MSRFKQCEIVDCTQTVSKSNPHIVKLVSLDEAFGKVHGHIPHDGKCPDCGDTTIVKSKAIKLKICNMCYQEFKDGVIGFMKISNLDRKIESFDLRKNTAYYSLATNEDVQNNDINDTDYYNGSNGRMAYNEETSFV